MNNPHCIFCKIAKGEIPAFKVYEDESVLAFLDINPVQYGHTLVIPKVHYAQMPETPDKELGEVFVLSKRLMQAVKRGTGADFVALSVVGTDVPHFHVHLIPRYKEDGLSGWPHKKYEEGEAAVIAEKIANQLLS